MNMRTELFTNCVDLVGSACRPFDGTKCYVSTGAVDTDHIDDCSIEIVDYAGKPSRANLEVDPGDVLFAKMQGTKKTLRIDSDLANHIYSTGFCAVKAKEDLLNRRCLFHLLSSEAFLTQKDRNCSGATQKAITNAGLKKIVIKVPNIEKQDSIADQLDCISRILEKWKKELETLDELIKARFVEMFGNPVDNDLEWDTITLNEACDGVGDGLHGTPEYDDNGDYPFINGNNLIDGTIEITPATKHVNEETYKKHYIDLSSNAILISINGTLGKLAFYNGEEVMLGKSACYCNLKPEIQREFVYGVMKSDAFARFLDENSTASTIKNVGLKAMRNFRLIMPPDNLQNSFIAFAKQVDKSKFVA